MPDGLILWLSKQFRGADKSAKRQIYNASVPVAA